MITGVVRDDQHELIGRLQDCASFLDRQNSAIVGQRVNKDYGVFSRLDHFVEVTDRAVLDGGRERPVVPHRFVALQ